VKLNHKLKILLVKYTEENKFCVKNSESAIKSLDN